VFAAGFGPRGYALFGFQMLDQISRGPVWVRGAESIVALLVAAVVGDA
jgi:hypothetical protein